MTTTSHDIHSDAYRPTNVRVEYHPEGGIYGSGYPFVVVDFDGTPMQWLATREQAEARRKQRAGVIKAALTRRANKARRIR